MKKYNMDHITYKVSNTTVALFNCCQRIKKDRKGSYVEIATGFDVSDNTVITEKQYK